MISEMIDKNKFPDQDRRTISGHCLRKLFLGVFIVLLSTTCRSQEFVHARLLTPTKADSVEENAIHVFQVESSRRTLRSWTAEEAAVVGEKKTLICLGRMEQIPELLPAPLRKMWLAALPKVAAPPAEGYTIRTLSASQLTAIVVAGNDNRGLLFGIGYLLRKMELSPNHAILTEAINLSSAPEFPVRGHQIGYRFKNNSYDAWTLPMLEQHIRELALFGTNTIQLITPHSDDAPSSPLFPAPALETTIGLSRILDRYGLDCDIFYPELRKDYADPAQVEAELKDFEELFRQLPRVDAVYVPGGDPGHTAPKDLFPLLEKEAAVLHKYHPRATMWVSAQGFSSAWYHDFYELMDQHPRWLTGVFFGPQSRESLEQQRQRIPREYPIIFYPDIGHTMHAQFPVPEWDPAFAITEGREPINPRPEDETTMFRHFAPYQQGFITYSEGTNDDVNKFLWTQLGWSQKNSPKEILGDYSRFFLGPKIGPESSESFTQGLFELEKNWRGPLLENAAIEATLLHFQRLEAEATPEQKTNWRFEALLYRAYYDAFLRSRLRSYREEEAKALHLLDSAQTIGSQQAIQQATASLETALSPEQSQLRQHIFSLADSLYQHCRIQLSVKKYGASAIERGANLDRVDASLNDRNWLLKQFSKIETLPTEEARRKALQAIVHWADPVPGTLYDDLGEPAKEPHLVRGTSFAEDPEMYDRAIDGIADKTPDDGWRYSWVSYAETLYEDPIELKYQHLDPNTHYKLRITYAGEDYALPIRLVANDRIEIHPPLPRDINPKIVEFDIPSSATQTGELDLKWTRPSGLGGSGRGHQVAEVWLIPQK